MASSQERIMTSVGTAIEWQKTETKQKPLRIKQAEVNRLMAVSPDDLSPEHPVTTPVGSWTMDGPEAIFHPVSEERLQEITIPDFKERRKKFLQRAKELIIKYGVLD